MIVTDDILEHYGVKGMKWGVSRTESHIAEAKSKKADSKRFKSEMGKALDKRFDAKAMTQDDYEKLSTGKHFVEKGTVLKRVVSKSNMNAPDTYVSTNKQDAENYKIALGRKILGLGSDKHEVTLKAVNRLASPSPKERVDAFVSLMDTPSIQLRNGKSITGREYLKKEGFGRDVRKLDSQQLGLKHYNRSLESQWMNTPINTAWYNSIRDRGYNALVDDNDAGILSKEPLIILNPSGDVKRMDIKPITKEDITRAQREFKAPD